MSRIAKAVANALLDLASADDAKIDPLQMQKLVFLCQGWCLGLTGWPLFDQEIEAWDYGPVVPDLYQSLKIFGSGSIRGRLKVFHPTKGAVTAEANFDDDETEIIEAVWEKYGSWSGSQLISYTHKPGGPWDSTRRSYPGQRDARIPSSLIEEWFEKRADEASLVNAD